MPVFRRLPRLLLVLAAGGLSTIALAQASPVSPAADSVCAFAARGIPARPAQARGGNAFADSLAGLTEPERDRAIRDELLSGNLPPALRRVSPATVTGQGPDGTPVQLVLCVLADYLAVGADLDALRVPMGLDSARAVAAGFGFTLPTRRMVDLIYRQATVQLLPQPLPAGEAMRSTATYRQHQALVEQQRAAVGALPGALTAGHKKDLVISERLWRQPDRVAIYGWHRRADAPIQPLSTVHGARYADYSHGVRLVSETVLVDGLPRSIFDLLADPQWSSLLSDEGPLPKLLAWMQRVPGLR